MHYAFLILNSIKSFTDGLPLKQIVRVTKNLLCAASWLSFHQPGLDEFQIRVGNA